MENDKLNSSDVKQSLKLNKENTTKSLKSEISTINRDNKISCSDINMKSHNQSIDLIQKNDENTEAYQISVFNDGMHNDNINKTNSKNNKKNSKGYLLEYRIKRLLFLMGYFPKTGVLIKTSLDELSDDITDLDVYGVYMHKNFASKTIWADCKSGSAKSLERISWLIGVKNIVDIDDVIFVKKGVRYDTRQFARRAGIQVLDLEIINKLENDFGIDPNDWRGSWNPESQRDRLLTFQRINVPSNDYYKKIGSFIKCGYWQLDNYTKVKKTVTALKQLAKFEQVPLPKEQNESIRWAIYELVNLFVLALLNICKEVYYFSDKDKSDTLFDGLISGEISAKKRADIVKATYKLAYSMFKSENPEFSGHSEVPQIGLNPPSYFEALNDLILRITNNPLAYFDILRFLDFILMEFDLQSKDVDSEMLIQLFPNYDSLIISAKTIMHFICKITGLSRELFNIIR